jgi:hypothetical protein
MIVYTAHEPVPPSKDVEERAADVVFVKEGFTWFGFLVPPVWLLVNRLWFEFIALLLLMGGATAILFKLGVGPQSLSLVNLAAGLLIGFEGNNLIRWRLERKGYGLVAAVAGRDFEEVERRFFDQWTPGATMSANAGNGPLTPPAQMSQQQWQTGGPIGTFG